MFLKARLLELEAKKPIVVLNREDAEDLDVRALDRVELAYRGKREVAIVNLAEKMVKRGEIGLFGVVIEELRAKEGKNINVSPSLPPESLLYIRKKLNGRVLDGPEIRQIVKDVVNQKLSEVEIASFVTSLFDKGMTMDETTALSVSMAETGKVMRFGKKEVFDKHSIGGVPGDKTSILVVPIVAAAGLTIPKTSSRAITSPAGTADRFECIAPVELEFEEIKRVVNKTGGCLVWGGAVDLAPADDIFIKVEYPLSIDPMLLPSVMSKKMAMGSKYLVIDIPTGRGTKVKTIGEASELANNFIELGKRVGIKVSCLSSFGEQPIGYAMGPALEAREALQTLLAGKGPYDLVEKACVLAGTLLRYKKKDGMGMARKILSSGMAGKKIKEIISAQGGDQKIRPGDIPVGPRCAVVKAACPGKVWWVSNNAMVHICREAGAPKDKGAGILLKKKLGDSVKKGETLFEIYSEKPFKLSRALQAAAKHEIMGIGEKYDVVLARIPEEKHEKHFILER